MRERIIAYKLLTCSCAMGVILVHGKDHSWRPHRRRTLALRLRGGAGFGPNLGKGVIELNPNYVPPGETKCIKELTRNREDKYGSFTYTEVLPDDNNDPKSLSLDAHNAQEGQVVPFQHENPSMNACVVACIAIYLGWKRWLPLGFSGQYCCSRKVLMRWFVASRRNLLKGRWLSLFLSAISHQSIWHLLLNLQMFLKFGAEVRRRCGAPLWPLMLGSALSGSMAFVILDPNNYCVGLSAVALSLFTVYCRLTSHFDLLFIVLATTIIGLFFETQSKIAHSGHLGGILYGLGYYQLWASQRRRLLARNTIPDGEPSKSKKR